MNNINYFLLICLLLVSCTLVKPDKDKERINAVCDNFMKDFSEGRLSKAYARLKENSNLLDSVVDNLQASTQEQLQAISTSYGKMISYELASEHTLKGVLAKRIYVLKFERCYLKFNFILYDNGNGWKITAFKYDDDVNDLL